MAKFCANLSFMYLEKPFLERYILAKQAGFKGVEGGFPSNDINTEEAIKNAILAKQVLVNMHTDPDLKGCAALPGYESTFKDNLAKTVDFAKATGTKKIHLLAGLVKVVTPEHDATYESNLSFAAQLLEKHNIIGVIEPINKHSLPDYYLNCFDKAVHIIKKINSPHLRLMVDIFHLQKIQGDITRSLTEFGNLIGHVQIAQVPNRNEPDTPGELNYTYIFDVLKKVGYNDWIGLEYTPATTANEGLKWIKHFNFEL